MTRLLGAAGALCRRDDEGLLKVGRDYRLETDGGLRAGLYVQGGTEHAHGMTSTLLSASAVRSGEIVASIATRPAVPPASGRRPLATVGDR